MATWTIAEDTRSFLYPSATLATHTYTLTSKAFTNTSGATSITLDAPTYSVKYNTNANGRNSMDDHIAFEVYAKDIKLTGDACATINTGFAKISANTLKSGTCYWGKQEDNGESNVPTPTVALSTLFTSSNPSERTVPLTWKPKANLLDMFYVALTAVADSTGATTVAMRKQAPSTLSFNEGSITLNAPPTFNVSALTKNTSEYVAGITTVSVTVSNAIAQYGGNITSAMLTVGSQSESISGNGTISMALQNTGTFTPTVIVTDSRGQTKTENLASITVIPYEKPSVDFDIFRTDEDGIKSDEGNYGVIAANLTYMGEVANLTEPTISINDASLTNYYAKTLDTVVDNNKTYYTYSGGSYTVVANPIDADIDLYYEKASITWYSNYNSQTGVSTPITNWSQVGSNNTATIYGLVDACFAALESYQITFIETDSLNGHSEAITQMLSTAFYTIDFQAGGKEIAFGMPANDDLTNYSNGLFKCGMDAMFKDNSNTMRMLFDFIYPVGSYYETSLPAIPPSGNLVPTAADIALLGSTWFNPNLVWGGTWELEAGGRVHIGAGANEANTISTWGSYAANTNTWSLGEKGGETQHLLQAAESGNQAQTITSGGMSANSSHSHGTGASGYSFLIANGNVACNSTARNFPSSGGSYHMVFAYSSVEIGEYSATESKSVAHTHDVSVAAKNATSNHPQMQPYIVVNRWHRIVDPV